MVIEQIYNRLKELDRKLSKSRFCTEYLGMSRNYWFVIRHCNAEFSNNALINLYGTLKVLSNTWRDISRDNASRASERYLTQYQSINELAELALGEIQRRAIA